MAPILDDHTLEFVSRSPDQTQRLGARLGALLQGGDIVCLEGPLGSGKTCLAQGIGRGWGVGQTLTSPTFVLIREYARPQNREGNPGGLCLYHVDLYRTPSEAEVLSLGVDDLLGDRSAVFVIEWAERLQSLIPPDHIWIRLSYPDRADQTRRALHFAAQGERHMSLLRDFRYEAFGA
jgi:tRNA threonylcarbamoyladenosine biosynthesis protein TsaE